MATATLPSSWAGRSGREYKPVEGARVRHGGAASVRKVVAVGPAIGRSTLSAGVPSALKLWNEGDETALDQLQSEARILVELSEMGGELPCPRLFDLIGDPMVTGLVMEWCPVNLEKWWRERLAEADAFGRLMITMAEAARRVSDYHVFYASRQQTLDAAHGDLKPANVLLSMEGRWVISDFGGARCLLIGITWDESRVVLATDNYLAPELVFNARRSHPASMDTWSLTMTAFALLRMRRVLLDGEPFPRTGTYSPRFRMERASQVIRIFERDPTRFFERDIDPDDFDDPLRVPDEDRRAIRDAMRGVFGDEDPRREERLAREVLEVMDQATSIEPAHRFTDARGLAAAFERLTRLYLEMTASGPSIAVDTVPEDSTTTVPLAVLDEKEAAERRVDELSNEVRSLAEQLRISEEARAASLDRSDVEELIRTETWRPPLWWGVTLVLILGVQGFMLLVVALLGMLAL